MPSSPNFLLGDGVQHQGVRKPPDFTRLLSRDEYGLQIHAFLNEHTAAMSCDDPNFRWHVKIQCKCCRRRPGIWYHFSRNDVITVNRGRIRANLSEQCTCGMEMRIEIVPDKFEEYLQRDNMDPKTVAVLCCTACEPIDFMFGSDWTVRSIFGTVYHNVDLTTNCGNWMAQENLLMVKVQGAWFYYFHLISDWMMTI